jgi:hypothetical protein
MATSTRDLLSGKLDNTEEESVASPAVKSTSLSETENLLYGNTIDPVTDNDDDGQTFVPSPGRLTPGRAVGAGIAGTKDVIRQVGTGALSMLELTSYWRDWEELENREREIPFSSFDQVDQSRFIRQLELTGTDPSKLSAKEFADARIDYQRGASKQYQETLQASRAYVQDKFATDPEYLTSTGWIEDFIRMGPQIGAQILAGLATGGVGSAALMFAQIAGGKTEMLMKEGVDFETAATAGLWDALLQTPLEQLAIGKLTKFMKTRGNIVAKMKKAVDIMGTEFLTEYAQAYPDAATEIWGKNPDATKMAMVEEFLDRIVDPKFHTEAAKEGIIAATWSLVAGGASRIKSARADIPNESGARNIEVATDKDGVSLAVPDIRNQTDVRNEAENVSSVETLLGIEGDTSTTPDGVSVSTEQNVTDEQREMQHQSTDAIKQVLGEIAGEKAMFKANQDIETAEARIDFMMGHYNDAVEDENAEGALQLANQMDEQTSIIATSYQELLRAGEARSKNQNMLPNPDHASQVQSEVERLQKDSRGRVEAQTANVRLLEQQERQAYIDKLDTDQGLEDELVASSITATRSARPKEAKLYNNVISEMKFRNTVGNIEYFSKTPMKKLINLKVEHDLNDAIVAEDPNVSGAVLARNEAVGRWINEQINDRLEYDQVQLVGDRVIHDAKIEQKQKAEAVAKTQAAEAKPAVKTIERRKKIDKAQRQRKERGRVAEVAKKAEKGKRSVSDLAKALRKPRPAPTRTAELKAVKEAKATRVAEVEKQVKMVEGLERPTTPIEKGKATVKDLKKGTSNFVIVTSDNPKSSKTTSKEANVKARSKLKKKLDELGIDYTLGTSKFEGTPEVPFVIHNMSRAEAKKLSDELDQSSFIVAEGDKVHFIEGGEINTVKRSDLKKAPDATDNFTVIGGEKFTIPFFEDTILEQKLEDSDFVVIDFDKMKLKDKMDTIELMESLEKEMKLGKYKFVFERTGKSGTKTVFVTQPGQYGKIPEVVRQFPNLKARETAINNFEQGFKGVFLPKQNMVAINLPSVLRTAKTVKKAFETMVHEHVHALHKIAFDNMSQSEKNAFGQELKAIWAGIDPNFIKLQRNNKDVPLRVRAGLHQINLSINELVSYSMAHPEFAAWLDSIEASPRFQAKSSKIKTMWDALVDLILNRSIKIPSKLDEVQDVLNRHLKDGRHQTRFSKVKKLSGSGKWKAKLAEYQAYKSKSPNATNRDIVDNTGLSLYEVEQLVELGRQNRFSKDAAVSFDFGENFDQPMASEWAADLDANAVNALPVTVVESTADAEVELNTFVPNNAQAIWTGDGKLVMISDKFESQEEFTRIWMHEQVAHQGLRNVFGKNTALFNRFLDQSYTLFSIKEQDALVDMAQLQDIFVGKDAKGKWVMKFTKAERRLIAEEMIARKAESLKPVTKRGLITRFKAFIKRWLPARFIDVKAPGKLPLSDKDIMNMLEIARENVLTGSNQFGQLLDKAVAKRQPKHKSLAGKNVPKFMESDDTYLKWAEETQKAAPNLKKWYSQHVETIKESFGKDTDLFNILLAITSPQADVEINVQYAINTYAYMMGARDMPGGRYPNKVKQRIDSQWTSPDRMLADLESKQFKVTEFARALLGDANATVGDLWMYRLFYGDPATTVNKDDEMYNVAQITALRDKLHSLAAQMSEKTGEVWTPREMQAALWVNINAKQTGKDISKVASYQSGLNKPTEMYGGKTPLEWLKSAVPGLSEGKLSDVLGIENIPLAPISPLQKKLIFQKGKDVKGKYPISKDGVIRVLSPGVDNNSTARMMNAIVAGGREVTATSEEMAPWYQKTFGFETVDDSLHMRLSDHAIQLYSDKNDKIKINLVRDNLSGFSGNYTRAIRFSKDAAANMDEMAALNSVEDDGRMLSTQKEQESHVSKIHIWRDQAQRNIDRFINQIEQEFLEKFGGRRSRVKGVGTGRWLHTVESEVMEMAMNLYIDSGSGTNRQKVIAMHKRLTSLGKNRTGLETEKLQVMDTMLSMSAGAQGWANENIRPQYDQWFKFAQDHKIIETHIEDYVKRTWKMPKKWEDAGVVWNGGSATGFKLTSDSGKQRSFDSIIDGWEAGMELRTTGVVGNLQSYASEVSFVYANRRFVDYMRSLISPGSIDGVMVVRDSDVKPPEGFVKLTTRGFAQPGKVVYARADIGKLINKIGRTASHSIWNKPITKVIRKVNAMLKSTILSVTMFHHLAGLRSYVFGVKGTGWQRFRPFKAYKEGLRKLDEHTLFDSPNYQHLGPIVDRLVQQGLTIGRVQDWDTSAIMDSTLEEWLGKRKSRGAKMALHGWKGLRRQKRQLTNGLFGQLFAGLKAQSAAVELTREIGRQEKKLGRGLTDAEVDIEAEKIAALINADFGGLHLERMGRDPDYQRVAQMILLAPDWTESNWRTVTGMIPGVNKMIDKAIGDNPAPAGMSEVYRHFWRGIVFKGFVTVLAAQLAVLSLFGDEDDWDEYHNQLAEFANPDTFAKGRWAAVDITPVARTLGLGPTDGKRVDLNIIGHFKDIFKAATPVDLAKHKVSPVARLAESMISRTDWKGDRFRTLEELWTSDDWSLTADPYNDPKELQGWLDGMQQLVLASAYNLRQSLPIPLSEVAQAAQGESSWLTSLGRAGGIDVRDVRHKDPNEQFYWNKSQEIKRLERNLEEAKQVRDNRMITEARVDMRKYDNFNQTKSRLGFARSRLRPINKKIRALETKIDRGIETSADVAKLQDLKRRKADIYKKFADVLGR